MRLNCIKLLEDNVFNLQILFMAWLRQHHAMKVSADVINNSSCLSFMLQNFAMNTVNLEIFE